MFWQWSALRSPLTMHSGTLRRRIVGTGKHTMQAGGFGKTIIRYSKWLLDFAKPFANSCLQTRKSLWQPEAAMSYFAWMAAGPGIFLRARKAAGKDYSRKEQRARWPLPLGLEPEGHTNLASMEDRNFHLSVTGSCY